MYPPTLSSRLDTHYPPSNITYPLSNITYPPSLSSRLDTVMDADKIMVMHQGQVA